MNCHFITLQFDASKYMEALGAFKRLCSAQRAPTLTRYLHSTTFPVFWKCEIFGEMP
ncbi:protein of unknown function (plasmid) [Paraburkholderia dioscoreae]|uniref:Uncharacterized protein n=1 Tax=Paraburkholderia dioscoreae TaxID=2604047 RepID=A0A5Q4ZE01_9BURK|nr:protein of unknown function [Paraburkholderia dioscoreae]